MDPGFFAGFEVALNASREALFLDGDYGFRWIHKAAGRYEQAVAEARKAIEFDPDFAMAYFNLGVNNVYLNRPEEAENALRRAIGSRSFPA